MSRCYVFLEELGTEKMDLKSYIPDILLLECILMFYTLFIFSVTHQSSIQYKLNIFVSLLELLPPVEST